MRPIDADALLDKLKIRDLPIRLTWEIQNAPVIDAVPVVRCRECRLHGICSTEDVFRFADLSEENRYCGAGQRREDGDWDD